MNREVCCQRHANICTLVFKEEADGLVSVRPSQTLTLPLHGHVRLSPELLCECVDLQLSALHHFKHLRCQRLCCIIFHLWLLCKDEGRSGCCAPPVCVQTDEWHAVVSVCSHTHHHCGQSLLLLSAVLHRPRRHPVSALRLAHGLLVDSFLRLFGCHRSSIPALSLPGLWSCAAADAASDCGGVFGTSAASSRQADQGTLGAKCD
ncbi:uncharacterized protein [Pseudorasbora parva]|uniref:uncharacterized protein isoform X3 n=1 Tax=Pseudorasbora parva TaxID=51549 RepID=UPI00351DE5D3